ncbi:PH domain-containing protein [Paenibacillus sp. PR3]|uniref:PH domain-containing protein n=1 Tax=Paenibacillus terricola TaxID=2763503 RepID=A0ABR8MSW4_9BACL|nr:PH domain-containing protein [Paenibacillus terricola]MBD3919073.1 PH domain-containing protein [Paenibacillus terricola]
MDEQILWSGKPFNYGLPSFTKYTISNTRIIIESGIVTKRRKEIRLYRIRDGSTKRNLWERILGIGDITVISTDADLPVFALRNIRKPVAVADILLNAADISRKTNRAYEMTEVHTDQ